jgi:hypothetical protein
MGVSTSWFAAILYRIWAADVRNVKKSTRAIAHLCVAIGFLISPQYKKVLMRPKIKRYLREVLKYGKYIKKEG